MRIKPEHLLICMMEHSYNSCIRATLAAGGHLVKYCWIMQEQAILWIIKTLIEFCISILLPGRMTDSLASEAWSFWQLLKIRFLPVIKVAIQDRKVYVLVTEMVINCYQKSVGGQVIGKKTQKNQTTNQTKSQKNLASVLNMRFHKFLFPHATFHMLTIHIHVLTFNMSHLHFYFSSFYYGKFVIL